MRTMLIRSLGENLRQGDRFHEGPSDCDTSFSAQVSGGNAGHAGDAFEFAVIVDMRLTISEDDARKCVVIRNVT